MGLFSKKEKTKDEDTIVSAVILEQTQLYKSKSNWGVTFGKTFGDGQVIAMDGSVPAGTQITFSITYKSGKQAIRKVMSGTTECDRLLQLAIDPPPIPTTPTDRISKPAPAMVSLEKNQLPTGKYLIGKDIPVGTYDFTWVWGNGSITKFANDHDTTVGATTYFQWVGDKQDYEFRQCVNVQCTDGELLDIQGNLIVGICKSKQIELDL